MASNVQTLVDFAYLTQAYVDVNFRVGGDPDDKIYYTNYTKDGDTSGGISFKTTNTVGLGMWGRSGELGNFHKDTFQKGRIRETFFLVDYSNGYYVSRDLMFGMQNNKRVRDDQYKFLEDRNKQLKEGYWWLREVVALKFQTQARSTTPDGVWPGPGSDALAMCSTVHKTIRAPLQTVNNAQGGQPLTMMSMIETTSMVTNMRYDDNRPGRVPDKVTFQIGRYNQYKVKIPLYTKGMPGTANNDINVLTQGGKDEYNSTMDYFINPHLSETDTSWLAFTKRHMMYAFEPSKTIMYQSEVDINTAAMTCVGRNYFAIDFHEFRDVVQAPSS